MCCAIRRVPKTRFRKMTDIPENPVGSMLDQLREAYPEFTEQSLPEIVDLAEAREIMQEAMYVEPSELHRVDANKILRYDLTLPLLLTVRKDLPGVPG
jgi:hypothetical protein